MTKHISWRERFDEKFQPIPAKYRNLMTGAFNNELKSLASEVRGKKHPVPSFKSDAKNIDFQELLMMNAYNEACEDIAKLIENY
jgi:hypothetical protein